jgi:hypothetical protein
LPFCANQNWYNSCSGGNPFDMISCEPDKHLHFAMEHTSSPCSGHLHCDFTLHLHCLHIAVRRCIEDQNYDVKIARKIRPFELEFSFSLAKKKSLFCGLNEDSFSQVLACSSTLVWRIARRRPVRMMLAGSAQDAGGQHTRRWRPVSVDAGCRRASIARWLAPRYHAASFGAGPAPQRLRRHGLGLRLCT